MALPDGGRDPSPGPDGGGGTEPDDPDADRLLREARATLEGQLTALDELERKAFRLLQFATGLLGVVVSALALAPQPVARAANPYTAFGVAALLVATLSAAATYAASRTVVGVGPAALERALSLPTEATERALVEGYADWIRTNESVNGRLGRRLTLTVLAVAAGAVGLTLGVLRAVLGRPLSPAVPLLAAVALLGTAVLAGGGRMLRRALGGDGAVPVGRGDRPDGAAVVAREAGGSERSRPAAFAGQRTYVADSGDDRGGDGTPPEGPSGANGGSEDGDGTDGGNAGRSDG